jgi:hypothetical protein
MPDPTPASTVAPSGSGVDALAAQVAGALSDILRSSSSPEVLQAQQLLLQRLALQGDVFSSRIPVPRNITEVGGYMNLLARLGESEIRTQALAAALGVAGPNPMPGLHPTRGVLFDVSRPNDRPPGPAQAGTPVQFLIRNDFAPAFDVALQAVHDAGCALPLLGVSPAGLPPLVPGAPALPGDLLLYLGRVLRLMPTAALADPDEDALAVAREDGETGLQVVARQLFAGAPQAGAVAEAAWVAWSCDTDNCTESTDDRTYLPLTPILNAAGWYQPAPEAPTTAADTGPWWRWTNTTGLVPGVSRYGDELLQRFTPGEIAGSALRDALALVWDGEGFGPG